MKNGPNGGGNRGEAAYRSPHLVSYGKIRELTASGSGMDKENTGKDDDNNKKKMP